MNKNKLYPLISLLVISLIAFSIFLMTLFLYRSVRTSFSINENQINAEVIQFDIINYQKIEKKIKR